MKTKISDVIIPEVFTNYVIHMTKELSALIQSGVAVQTDKYDEFVTRGGDLIHMPFWNPLSGEDEVLSDVGSLTPSNITASQDVAVKLFRGKAWSANQLAAALAGSSPMQAIAAQVADWWSIREQKTLISILTGIFTGTLASSHVNDISSVVGAGGVIGSNAILDTKQLLGDAANKFKALAMHSAVKTALQKQNLIDFIPDARGEVQIPYYLGYRIIEDDGCPNAGGVYSTYLFGAGAFGRGDGIPNVSDFEPVEMDRDVLAGDSVLVNNRAYLLHPHGVKYTRTNQAESSPTNEELADPVNWEKVVEDKNIALALLKHRIV